MAKQKAIFSNATIVDVLGVLDRNEDGERIIIVEDKEIPLEGILTLLDGAEIVIKGVNEHEDIEVE